MTDTRPVLWTGTPVAFEEAALVPVPLAGVEVVELATCAACGKSATRLKRLGGVGRAVCSTCYQRAKRSAQVSGEPFRLASIRSTVNVLYDHLLQQSLAPRTIKAYMRTIWSAERWFDEQGWSLSQATPSQIATYAATKPNTNSSRLALRAALTHYWTLVGHPKPPAGAIRVPKHPSMVCRALEEDDARTLAKAARDRGDRHGLAVLLGLYQALRREEIATLSWAALDVQAGWLRVVGKGSKTRVIPLHPVVITALDAFPRPSDYLFPGRSGTRPVAPATIWAWVREVASDAGLPPVRCHWLRHTCLATQNDKTTDLRTVQHFAGHAKPETTAGYTRASKERLVQAVLSIDY